MARSAARARRTQRRRTQGRSGSPRHAARTAPRPDGWARSARRASAIAPAAPRPVRPSARAVRLAARRTRPGGGPAGRVAAVLDVPGPVGGPAWGSRSPGPDLPGRARCPRCDPPPVPSRGRFRRPRPATRRPDPARVVPFPERPEAGRPVRPALPDRVSDASPGIPRASDDRAGRCGRVPVLPGAILPVRPGRRSGRVIRNAAAPAPAPAATSSPGSPVAVYRPAPAVVAASPARTASGPSCTCPPRPRPRDTTGGAEGRSGTGTQPGSDTSAGVVFPAGFGGCWFSRLVLTGHFPRWLSPVPAGRAREGSRDRR